jgi:hypothetical protein
MPCSTSVQCPASGSIQKRTLIFFRSLRSRFLRPAPYRHEEFELLRYVPARFPADPFNCMRPRRLLRWKAQKNICRNRNIARSLRKPNIRPQVREIYYFGPYSVTLLASNTRCEAVYMSVLESSFWGAASQVCCLEYTTGGSDYIFEK